MVFGCFYSVFTQPLAAVAPCAGAEGPARQRGAVREGRAPLRCRRPLVSPGTATPGLVSPGTVIPVLVTPAMVPRARSLHPGQALSP